ncbi:GAF domain-containing protein [Croceicoccus hydrothermalis]|uniref:GAF domain-containing protein n=1 Tax=Croceicoccus hydrothermalis TaxID=2867964 RepID=UPI001EFBE0BE|nr:GAF domain-containing protein [Croceicoccus hydrothermalis]
MTYTADPSRDDSTTEPGDTAQSAPPGQDRAARKRRRALDDYRVLDTGAEDAFDEIAFIASQLCDAPVALISLVEADRQWFKARIGFEACETPISQSVCRHGMHSDRMLVIEDLTKDARTAQNPLVTADPHIRFYAGAPLITPGGTIIGMLCVIDTVPRPGGLSREQQRMLTGLARQVVNNLELRREVADAERETAIMRRTVERMRLAEEAGHVGAFEVDLTTGIVETTREFRRIYGLDDASALDVKMLSAMQPGDALRFDAVDDADDLRVSEYEIEQPGGARRWVQRRAELAPGKKGEPDRLYGVITDVTEQRAINQEMSHRLKNSLALVQAIASHTLRGVADAAPVMEFNRRIAALSSAHDILLSRTHAAGSLRAVVDAVLSRLGVEERAVWSGADFNLASRPTLLLSILVHELATNAMKYGALSVEGGRAEIASHVEDHADGPQLVVEWREIGGPPATEPEKKGLGMRLVQSGLDPAGSAKVTFGEEGMAVRFTAPVARVAG